MRSFDEYYELYWSKVKERVEKRKSPKLIKMAFDKDTAEKLLYAYWFLRWVDDVVDDADLSKEERINFVKDVKRAYKRPEMYQHGDTIEKLREMAEDEKKQKSMLYKFLNAMEKDIRKEGDFYSYDELLKQIEGMQTYPGLLIADIAGLDVPYKPFDKISKAILLVKQVRPKEIVEDLSMDRFYISIEEAKAIGKDIKEVKENFVKGNFGKEEREIVRNRLITAKEYINSVDDEEALEIDPRVLSYGLLYAYVAKHWAEKLAEKDYVPYSTIKFTVTSISGCFAPIIKEVERYKYKYERDSPSKLWYLAKYAEIKSNIAFGKVPRGVRNWKLKEVQGKK